jgi:hypothetical protein
LTDQPNEITAERIQAVVAAMTSPPPPSAAEYEPDELIRQLVNEARGSRTEVAWEVSLLGEDAYPVIAGLARVAARAIGLPFQQTLAQCLVDAVPTDWHRAEPADEPPA